MLTMLEIVGHDDQLLDTTSVLELQLYHGAVRDNQLWHYPVPKHSIDQQQWQHKKAPGLSS